MTNPEEQDLEELEPELELEALDETAEEAAAPEASPEPPPEPEAAPAVPATTEAASDAAQPDPAAGQWVWQYGAPPPPPSFGAVFFSGTALPELYRFFACGLMVVLGCFLPWGGDLLPGVDGADPSVVLGPAGVTSPLGALSLVIGLWLVFSSCYGIYTRKQKILPVFLMLEPAYVSWTALLASMDAAGDAGILTQLEVAGSGTLLTLLGSTFVSLQFLSVVVKVYTKKDDKAPARRSKGKDAKGKDAKGKDGDDKGAAGKGKAKGGKGRKKS